jgi:hypothetical protein
MSATSKYESAAETAKKVRMVLKFWFPGIKFSVRSSNYAGGCSIRVSYTNGPAYELVNSLVRQMTSAGFDGMQDLKTYHDYYWMGEAFSGADYIFVDREITDDVRLATEMAVCADYGIDYEPVNANNIRIGGRWLSDHVYQQLRSQNIGC